MAKRFTNGTMLRLGVRHGFFCRGNCDNKFRIHGGVVAEKSLPPLTHLNVRQNWFNFGWPDQVSRLHRSEKAETIDRCE